MKLPPKLRNAIRFAAYNLLPKVLLKRLRYPKEQRFIEQGCPQRPGKPSVVFFTSHKCASVLMGHMLDRINRDHLGLVHLDLASYVWDTVQGQNQTVQEHLQAKQAEYFKDQGYLYAPIRNYLALTELGQARQIVMLRDPRDVLVSSYFSLRYSHRPPADPARKKRFLENRHSVESQSLDAYVTAQASDLRQRYERYRCHFPAQSLLTYEQMWHDFPSFAQNLGKRLGLTFDRNYVEILADIADIGSEASENVMSHRRKGTPGDFSEKLDNETIQSLNRIFADILDWMAASK